MPGQQIHAIVVMGVSGCGKSSVGKRLAQLLACEFVEGDELHPLSNVQKMSEGVPLTDEDRWPWLDLVRNKITHAVNERQSIVVSCSALRRDYRQHLRRGQEQRLAFIFLDGTSELLKARMTAREGHFMPPSLLATQLATLENPSGEDGVMTVSIDNEVEQIALEAAARIQARSF